MATYSVVTEDRMLEDPKRTVWKARCIGTHRTGHADNFVSEESAIKKAVQNCLHLEKAAR